MLVADKVGDHVPATQLVHAAAPEAAHEPATHDVHTELVEAPRTLEAVPGMQFRQETVLDAPELVEYVPTPQLTQNPELVADVVVEYVPGMQLAHDVEYDTDHVPATQEAHAEMVEAPERFEYVPAAQPMQ